MPSLAAYLPTGNCRPDLLLLDTLGPGGVFLAPPFLAAPPLPPFTEPTEPWLDFRASELVSMVLLVSWGKWVR